MTRLFTLREVLRPARRSRWLAVALGGLLGLPSAAAPGPALDSLRQAWHRAPTDTDRVKTALRLSAALAATDTAAAGQYARHALVLSRQAHYGYGLAYSWLQLGTLALVRHDQATAAVCGERAQAVAAADYRRVPAPRLRRLLASIANNQGNVADFRGQYAVAAGYYLRAASQLVWLGDTHTLLTVYGNLGTDFQVLGQPAQAARYWRQAVALGAGPPPAPELLPVYLQLGNLHLAQAHPDSAWQVLQAARPLAVAGQLYRSEYYGTLAQYYLHTGRWPAARRAFQQALTYARQKGASAYQAELLLGLGQLEARLGNVAQARTQLQQSLALGEHFTNTPHVLATLDALARLEETAEAWQPALRYYQHAQRLRDTLAGAAVRRQVNQLEARYQARQQAQQLRAAHHTQVAQQLALRRQRQLNAAYLALLALLLGGGALGLGWWRHRHRLARRAQEQEKALLTTQAVLQGQDEERRRLARDLHDGLGGMLATVKLYLSSVRTRGGLLPESAPLLEQAISHLDGSVAELRRVARNLMPEALLTFGLGSALHDLCQAVQQAGDVPVQLTAHGLTPRLAPVTEVELYRIVQELLNNVLRHAHARQVLVQLMRYESELHLVVEDDGRGFDPRTAGRGVGLRSVQARAQYLGGQLDVQSQPGQGTSISLLLQLPAPAIFPAAEAAAPFAPSL